MTTNYEQQTTNYNYYHTDHLGSSSVISDAEGRETARYEYQPYGKTIVDSPKSIEINYLFTGKELDSTGLYYYGARYYDAEIGRFTQADPTVQYPYDPQDLNRYSYCRNNPINLIDPTGYGWFKDFVRNIIQEINRWFRQLEHGLEKVTGSEWDINVNVEYRVALGSGGSGRPSTSPSSGYYPSSASCSHSNQQQSQSQYLNKSKWGYGGYSSAKFRNNKIASVTAIYGRRRAWVGYGYSEFPWSDTKEWVMKNYTEEYNFFANNPDIDFVENPSWGEFKFAMTSGYETVGLDIHGKPSGLIFSDGTHSLSELSGINSQINVKDFGLVACYPKVHAQAWESLNISTTNFIDLSTPSPSGPDFTSAGEGIKDLKNFIDSRINN